MGEVARAVEQIECDDVLPIPPFEVETPCFVVLEDAVRHNLAKTIAGAGGKARLMPHVKTHRARWLVELMVAEGVTAFKAATPAEVEMALDGGAHHVVWAYPTANGAAIARVAAAARQHASVRVEALTDSSGGLAAWIKQLEAIPTRNVKLRIDLDPGLGRTGVPISAEGLRFAGSVREAGLFAGWHAYDGHIQDRDLGVRRGRIADLAKRLRTFLGEARNAGLDGDLIAAGSYSFYLWPGDLARFVSPGSWTYSSAQHESDLADVGWRIAGYVLATVVSARDGTATLDAGSKAISPDMPLTERFRGPGQIKLMKEEHTVIASTDLTVGDRVALVPRHGCTAAYLYNRALVRGVDGCWDFRSQLGANR